MSDRGTCAACGLPGHRYGRNEGMDRFDPMACINLLRAQLVTPADLLAAVRAAVESGTIEGEEVGWCPRGDGHWDMPESLDDAGDFGVCGSKWTRRFLLIPLVERVEGGNK